MDFGTKQHRQSKATAIPFAVASFAFMTRAAFCCIMLLLLSGCTAMRPVGSTHSQLETRRSVAQVAHAALQNADRHHAANNAQTRIANNAAATHRAQQVARTACAQQNHSNVATANSNVAQVSYQEELPRPAAESIARPVRRVSEIFVDTDVREAIQAIATQADVSVVIDEQVSGLATATIQDEPFDMALRKILLPLGLHYRFQDGQYLICSSDPESSMFSMVAQRLEYQPLHSSPDELAGLLMDKHQQFVRVADSRNMIIIEAPESVARHIETELNCLDRPVPQVVLEAMVVVVSPDSKFQFGMDLGQSFTDGDRTVSLALDGLALSGKFSQAAASDLFGKFSVTSHFLRSLEQEGYVSIRATPHVMAKNGEKAEISIARETFFSTQPADSQFFFRQDVQKVEAGISLELTPTIRGDSVTMVIDRAEVSEDIRSTINDSSLADPYPLINRRKVSTTVHVKDGETVVIGGLMQNQLVDRVSKVPFFGDLPLVGRAFQKIEQQEEAAEVVVFISPRIVHESVREHVQGPTHAPMHAPVNNYAVPLQHEVMQHEVISRPPNNTLPPIVSAPQAAMPRVQTQQPVRQASAIAVAPRRSNNRSANQSSRSTRQAIPTQRHAQTTRRRSQPGYPYHLGTRAR